jgi:hypothetical protein
MDQTACGQERFFHSRVVTYPIMVGYQKRNDMARCRAPQKMLLIHAFDVPKLDELSAQIAKKRKTGGQKKSQNITSSFVFLTLSFFTSTCYGSSITPSITAPPQNPCMWVSQNNLCAPKGCPLKASHKMTTLS